MSLKIAVVPGDGIGPEVIAAGMRVLEKVNADSKLGLAFTQFDWNADSYLATGISMPPGAMDDLRENYAAVYLGAYGDPRVPDMKHAADILLGMRFQLDLYVNYRPVKLLDERLCPVKDKTLADVDFVIFRENTEGLYVGMGGNFKKGTAEEIAAAREAGVPVWLVVDVGRRLPARLFDALVGRAEAAAGPGAAPGHRREAVEVVPTGVAERVVEPRRVDCPVPPELLRSPGGW